MSLLSTFATNSINILAGINGSETSQALIIALSVIINDLLYLPWPFGFRVPLHLLGGQAELDVGGPWSAGMAYGSRELVERHLFSLYFMLPLVGVCAGFLYHNWYVPSHQTPDFEIHMHSPPLTQSFQFNPIRPPLPCGLLFRPHLTFEIKT